MDLQVGPSFMVKAANKQEQVVNITHNHILLHIAIGAINVLNHFVTNCY